MILGLELKFVVLVWNLFRLVTLTLVAFVFFESVSSCHECVSLWYLTNRSKVAERSRLPALASGETG